MSLLGMLVDEVVVVRYAASGTDRYNQAGRVESSRTTYKARVEQESPRLNSVEGELNDNRATLISDWIAYLPADAVVGGHDEIIYDGSTFEVVGKPNVQKTPRGPHHTEVRMRLVTAG